MNTTDQLGEGGKHLNSIESHTYASKTTRFTRYKDIYNGSNRCKLPFKGNGIEKTLPL